MIFFVFFVLKYWSTQYLIRGNIGITTPIANINLGSHGQRELYRISNHQFKDEGSDLTQSLRNLKDSFFKHHNSPDNIKNNPLMKIIINHESKNRYYHNNAKEIRKKYNRSSFLKNRKKEHEFLDNVVVQKNRKKRTSDNREQKNNDFSNEKEENGNEFAVESLSFTFKYLESIVNLFTKNMNFFIVDYKKTCESFFSLVENVRSNFAHDFKEKNGTSMNIVEEADQKFQRILTSNMKVLKSWKKKPIYMNFEKLDLVRIKDCFEINPCNYNDKYTCDTIKTNLDDQLKIEYHNHCKQYSSNIDKLGEELNFTYLVMKKTTINILFLINYINNIEKIINQASVILTHTASKSEKLIAENGKIYLEKEEYILYYDKLNFYLKEVEESYTIINEFIDYINLKILNIDTAFNLINSGLVRSFENSQILNSYKIKSGREIDFEDKVIPLKIVFNNFLGKIIEYQEFFNEFSQEILLNEHLNKIGIMLEKFPAYVIDVLVFARDKQLYRDDNVGVKKPSYITEFHKDQNKLLKYENVSISESRNKKNEVERLKFNIEIYKSILNKITKEVIPNYEQNDKTEDITGMSIINSTLNSIEREVSDFSKLKYSNLKYGHKLKKDLLEQHGDSIQEIFYSFVFLILIIMISIFIYFNLKNLV